MPRNVTLIWRIPFRLVIAPPSCHFRMCNASVSSGRRTLMIHALVTAPSGGRLLNTELECAFTIAEDYISSLLFLAYRTRHQADPQDALSQYDSRPLQ